MNGTDGIKSKKIKPPQNETNGVFSEILSNELTSAFFDASDDFVFVLDGAGCFKFINKSGLNELEYSFEELNGKHFFSITKPEDNLRISAAFRKILESGSFVHFEVLLVSKNDRELLFKVSAKKVGGDNKISGIIGAAKNVSRQELLQKVLRELEVKYIEAERLLSIERNRLNQRKSILEELNRLKSEFVANISHEMRTPLASIIGFSETISSDSEMPAEMRREFNEIILKEGKRLAKLINDILDISRLESGENELHKKEINLISVIQSAVEANKNSFNAKGIALNLSIKDDEVKIIGDEERLLQVFNSLISNAINFSNPGGRILIIGQKLYKEYEIIFSDTGIGIPKKDLPHIFEKFYRVSRRGSEVPGAGLGLVFAKQIIDLHKGLITVESEVDKGSAFVIKLPLKN